MRHFNILDVSIYQIQLFLALADERNFSRAAELLNIAQPTLSRRISLLEEAVGVKLFDRNKRPVELTEAGELLHVEWRDIARKFERSIEAAKDRSAAGRQKLTVCSMDSGRNLRAIETAGRELEKQNPGVLFSWGYSTFSEWRSRLYSGDVDIMLVLRQEEDYLEDDLDRALLITCPKLVCMLRSNPLSLKKTISYEDLADQYFVVNSPKVAPSHYDYIRYHCMRHGFEPNVSRYTASPHELISSIKKDNEVAFCDAFHRDITSDMIKCFELPDTSSGLIAVWLKDSKNAFIRTYLELAVDAFLEYPP